MKKAVVINLSCHFNCCNSCSKTYNIDGQPAGCGSSDKARLHYKLRKEKEAEEAADYIAEQEKWKPEHSEVLQVVDGYRKDTKMSDEVTDKICNETMSGGALNSGRHVQYDSFDVKKNLPLPLHKLKPPLPQPPPQTATSDASSLQVAGCKSSAIVQSTASSVPYTESCSPTVKAAPSHCRLQEEVAAPSSADTAVLDTPRYSHAIAILPYNPRKEPEDGYLEVEKGTVIAVMTGSRSAAKQHNTHVCDYVFAWHGQKAGWTPVEILESVPPCQELMQKTGE